MSNIIISLDKDEQSTPDILFNPLNEEFNFTLDPAATQKNAKCEKFYTKNDNGLLQSWEGENAFLNPPYSKPENPCPVDVSKCKKKSCIDRGFHLTERKPGLKDWVEKCYTENYSYGISIVLLIPAWTDTEYFHEFIYDRHNRKYYDYIREVRFVKGKLHFSECKDPAFFPSILVIFKEGRYK